MIPSEFRSFLLPFTNWCVKCQRTVKNAHAHLYKARHNNGKNNFLWIYRILKHLGCEMLFYFGMVCLDPNFITCSDTTKIIKR